MLLLCATCGAGPEFAGPLCIEPVAWEPSRTQLVCKACVVAEHLLSEELVVMAADEADWMAHLDECSFCHRNRGLMPKGLLFQMCVESRRVRGEARERGKVMVNA